MYGGSLSVGTKTYPSSASIYLDDSATLTLTGDVTLQPGTEVRLGPDAEIKVNSGGSIDAEEVTFTTLDGGTGASDRWKHIKLLGGGSSFTDCVFKGADNAIYNYGYNYAYTSEFTDNVRGVQVADGTLQLVGSRIHNTIGDQSAWVRGDGWLVTREYTSSGYEPTRIQDAADGIKITDYGNVRSNHTRYTDNDDYHIYMEGQAELFAGSESWFSLHFSQQISMKLCNAMNRSFVTSILRP